MFMMVDSPNPYTLNPMLIATSSPRAALFLRGEQSMVYVQVYLRCLRTLINRHVGMHVSVDVYIYIYIYMYIYL